MDDPAAVVVDGRWPALPKLVWRKDFDGRSRGLNSPGAAERLLSTIRWDHTGTPARETHGAESAPLANRLPLAEAISER
jgi:hypothetical protein